MSLYVNEALPFQPLHSSKSAKQVADSAAAAAADSHSAATAQGAADEAAAADSSSDSAAASDPMQDIIKKAVQSQVAALSEVTPAACRLPPLAVCVTLADAVAGAEWALGRQDAALATAAAVARSKVTARTIVCT